MANFQLDRDEEKEYWRYKNDTIESLGFYVSNDCGASVPCGVVRIPKSDALRYKKAEHAAKYAVAKYNNENNNNMIYLGITNLNMQATAGALYYITFKTKDPSGYISYYQTKVLKKINTGFHVEFFELAPFSSIVEDNMEEEGYVMMKNLQPWMDENYLYYSCFYSDRKVLLDIKIEQESGECIALIRFNKSAEEEFVKKYNGAPMPYSNQCYNLVLRKD